MTLRDATEYQFATPTRRVMVREARVEPEPADLDEAARRYAETLRTLLDATEVTIEPAATTAGGAAVVVIRADVPPATPGASDQIVRAGLLRFGNGPIVELSLTAARDDAGAEAEFRRLLDSARPAALPDPISGVARAVTAGSTAGPDQPAGPIRIDLSPDYHASHAFLLASTDDTTRYHLEAAPPAEAATRSVVTGSILSAGADVATAEDGRTVRYETGVRPRLSPGRRPAAPDQEAAPAVRGGASSAPGVVVVEGKVGVTLVRVRITAARGTAPTAEQGEQLIRALNASR
jgi:hypothetical protein